MVNTQTNNGKNKITYTVEIPGDIPDDVITKTLGSYSFTSPFVSLWIYHLYDNNHGVGELTPSIMSKFTLGSYQIE